MPDSIEMTFSSPINSSLQVGDTIYKSVVTGGVAASPVELGKCTALTSTVITCEIPTTLARPASTDFILFSKNNKANLTKNRIKYYPNIFLESYNFTKAKASY